MKIITAAIAALATLAIAPTAAASSQSGCLHRADFHSVERTILSDVPAARERVHQTFGTKGRPVGHHTRVYQGCGEGSRVWLQFKRDIEGVARVVSTAYTARYFD